MSNGYSGPYQSRLLNFISKQSRQVADTCDRTWREVKLAALNAAQILLYPAYLLVQSSRMLGRQLRESTPQVEVPELQEFAGGENQNRSENWLEAEIDSESAIAGILNLAENLLLPEQTAANSGNFSFLINPAKAAADIGRQPEIPLSPKTAKAEKNSLWETQLAKTETASQPKVRGIATFLPARSLVLVSEENQILDILNLEQQQLLEGRIIWEVANSGPLRRQIAEKELKFNLGLESAAEQAKLPLVRRFWELMAWVQTSPVAINRNQFGESIVAVKKAVTKAVNAGDNRNLILTQKAIAPSKSNGRNLSELSINPNSKFDRAAVNLEEISLPPVLKNTAQLTAAQPGASETVSPSVRQILENYATTIEQMIWSSVDYLLGKETAASENTEKSVAIKYYLQQRELENTEKGKSAGDRPWLNWQDLFGESVGAVPPGPPPAISQTSTKVKLETKELGTLPEGRSAAIATSPYPEAIQSSIAQLKRSLLAKVPKSQPQTAENLEVTQKHSVAPAARESQQPKQTSSKYSKTSSLAASPTAISASKPEAKSAGVKQEAEVWLETKAESMGYVKHPLEQALEWLDRIMLQLEKIAGQVWKWAKINLSKILKSKQ